MLKEIQKEIDNQDSSNDYHDYAYLAYEYSDSLAKDMNIIPKTNKINIKYWLNVSHYDEWSNKNKNI